MLSTINTQSGTVTIDVFGVHHRPCRPAQESIYDYHLDGRPQFMWERLRHMLLLQGNEEVLNYCDNCPLNIFGGLEGCSGKLQNLDVFFRALGELAPESPWSQLRVDGQVIHPSETGQLLVELPSLRLRLSESTWPVCVPRFKGQPIFENQDEQEPIDEETDQDSGPSLERQAALAGGLFQFYAWNGEGPPALVYHNEGYCLYLSRHGLTLKPTGEDPIPHVFTRLWKEGRNMFGLSKTGDTVGFQLSLARLPSWGFQEVSGAELTFEAMPSDQVFREVLDTLEVFANVAHDFETGMILKL